MIALLLAAALTAATPAPAAPAAPNIDEIVKALPLVCKAHFIEEVKIKAAGLTGHDAKVIDIFAQKMNLSPQLKAEVQGFCGFFDLGASFVIEQVNEQGKTGPNGIHRMGRPTDHIAGYSFTR